MPFEVLKTAAKVPPVLSWAGHALGPEEYRMACNVASLPFVTKHLSLMPDVHLGKGSLVGSVIATKNAVVPAAVGVDIGCGMCALKLPLSASSKLEQNLLSIRTAIERAIPLGSGENRVVEDSVYRWDGWQDFASLHPGVQNLRKKAERQLGSLGGGNHFIEVCLDEEQSLWLMLHSGSRHVGNVLARRHMESASDLARMSRSKLPDYDLAHFVGGTKEFAAYWRDLQWAQEYARINRVIMMARVKRIVEEHLCAAQTLRPVSEINCHHNYAEVEQHFGENLIITRKGAVSAQKDQFGIIPGSMGARSYIVRGKGNVESFCSCSHGAGRRLSRREAKRKYSVKDLAEQTSHVECRKDRKVVDEIPAAYKNIDEVMRNQSDLVEVVTALRQIICVKG